VSQLPQASSLSCFAFLLCRLRTAWDFLWTRRSPDARALHSLCYGLGGESMLVVLVAALVPRVVCRPSESESAGCDKLRRARVPFCELACFEAGAPWWLVLLICLLACVSCTPGSRGRTRSRSSPARASSPSRTTSRSWLKLARRSTLRSRCASVPVCVFPLPALSLSSVFGAVFVSVSLGLCLDVCFFTCLWHSFMASSVTRTPPLLCSCSANVQYRWPRCPC
jgi:hypothetical protein